jgi:tRNA nucleotidyltransferase (CCA-adding enzyme)
MSKIYSGTINFEGWPFDRDLLPQSSFLVGGAVRDALLGRRVENLDLDFVVSQEAVATAREIASRYRAGFVLLDADRQIARVVFERATVDFAQMEGDSLEDDLHRRDFTINAIAYNPFSHDFIDPLNGRGDLQRRIIRMVRAANLEDDPLRLLRGYRQSAQLGFTIGPETLSTIRKLAPLLIRVAVERVRTELSYLLNIPGGMFWIERGWEDGLLICWFPTAGDRFSVGRNIDKTAALLTESWPELGRELSAPVRDTIKTTFLSIGKLGILVAPEPARAEAELEELKYSNVEIKGAIAVVKGLAKLQEKGLDLSVREQYFLFKEVGEMFPALAVVAVASGVEVEAIAPLINRYLNPEDLVAHPQPLLSGNDLMRELNLPKGRLIGELLREIQLARVEGKIATKEEGLELAAELINSQ